ncbi:ATP-binding cassette domain-containing protein [Mesorhizobium sp. RMAD-H1]|uniref:ABC transporter ATP-binding protein n=1 Tax=Mesorhizobium sp. RMAD-H1 TaxID=2587065 RepID=UPI001607F5F1|nr:ATP-binding cassette domain-containing protein [Mesorhizobium sp. RMAD-H1]MBB2972902.1 octopine/nopaline transport system ATP-binding protein [Mesorhizobium sp. RMAD-H1]
MPEQAKVPAVELSGIRKSYGQLEVLHGISLAAREGDVISILGSSGSGKSTLLRCINMLEIPNAGSVAIHGETVKLHQAPGQAPRPLDAAQVNRLRVKAAMVFQTFNLWSHLTILENLIEAPIHVQKRDRRECLAEAEALLERVGITDKRHAYPAHLSGGQQQRAAIARALAMRPSVMLFDEPTSALDPELVGEVLKVMRDLAAEGRTMLIVTHEMAFARDVSSRIVFIDKGIIEEDGPPSDVFSNPRSERFRQFISREEAGYR